MASVKVAVRVRPFNNRERDMDAKVIVEMDAKKTRLHRPKHSTTDSNSQSNAIATRENFHDFTFDHSHWSFEDGKNGHQHVVDQEEVYSDLGVDVVNSAFQGYNACVFAYGQTGSGKTFTMMGSPDSPGLIPRICREMFSRQQQKSSAGYKTHVSYLEIYNERVKDLLGATGNVGHGLRVREHRTLGPYVEGLSLHPVNNYEEIQECINRGNSLRTTASTNMNDTSSRSHAIFTITFVQAVFMDEMPSETVSKIHLVDLAGSERANATGATGERLKEGAHINKSLVTLGSVISALAEQSTVSHVQSTTTPKKRTYIPYRDSVLTWLLKDSLGGNSKTIMIAAISPADCNYSETLSTLRYANRAKNIINKPTINEDSNVKLIRELREEIMKLKNMLSCGDIDETAANRSSQMLEDLIKKEAQEKFLTEEWAEKWRQAQSILREEKTLGLRKSGVGVILDSEAPHLIGIHDDVSTGVTLYSLREGETTFGDLEDSEGENGDRTPPVDIVLHGTGMLPLHCSIEINNGAAVIHPREGAECWLNANQITKPTRISQGDILLLGRTNMFRFNNPLEAASLRRDGNRSKSKTDLSRLSMIAASRENLTSSIHCFNDDDSMTSSMRKISSDQFEDIQEEHRKILETIESALQKLNSERTHIFEQHKSRVDQLTSKLVKLEKENDDKMAILNCRSDLLSARREMFAWNKANKKTQVDITVKQIAALQTQSETKSAELQELMNREWHDLKDQGDLTECSCDNSEINLEALLSALRVSTSPTSERIQNILTKKRTESEVIDLELLERERVLKENINEIAQLDETILSIDDQLRSLQTEKNELEKQLTAKETESMTTIESQATHTAILSLKKCQKPQLHSILCTMRILRQSIATQKAQIMKKLELNNCGKHELDDEIAKLQQLQKQYYAYEKDVDFSEESINRTEYCLSSEDGGDVSSEDLLRGIGADAFSNSGEKFSATGSDDCTGIHCKTHHSNDSTNSRSQLDANYDSEFAISVPSYVVRGAGKQTHIEYEIRITLSDDRWTLLRRFSRFRELHLTTKSIYGDRVAEIPFPKRELFASNSESVARNRRRQLEIYLRRLLVVCSRIPQCPFYEGPNGYGLNKATLIEFSQFFKKGIFESGKHGTG